MKLNHASSYSISVALLSAALFGAATPASKALFRQSLCLSAGGLLYLGAVIGVIFIIIKHRSRRPHGKCQQKIDGISSELYFLAVSWGPFCFYSDLKWHQPLLFLYGSILNWLQLQFWVDCSLMIILENMAGLVLPAL